MVFVRCELSDLLTIHGAEPADAWIQIEMPADRMAWREALATRTARGAARLIVPRDPRLVDLLRNQDTDDDRGDRQMSTGCGHADSRRTCHSPSGRLAPSCTVLRLAA